MDFQAPDRKEIMRAIGSTSGLALPLQRALIPNDEFDPIPIPHSGDWLSVQQEPGQTFDDFANGNPRKPDGRKNVIYLTPLGDFQEGAGPSLKILRECAEAYFMMEVRINPPVRINKSRFATRSNPVTGNFQLLTLDILTHLKKHIPLDAFCMLGITMDDLYPGEDWNFVFGQASLSSGTGVFSFARYDPAFYGNIRDKDYTELLTARCCKVLVHEIAHMFSLSHCIYYHCLMNGSNHLAESDARPMHLCPVCLHKIYHAVGFNVVQHYQKLFYFFRSAGFGKEARWVTRRLEHILGN